MSRPMSRHVVRTLFELAVLVLLWCEFGWIGPTALVGACMVLGGLRGMFRRRCKAKNVTLIDPVSGRSVVVTEEAAAFVESIQSASVATKENP